LVERLTLNQIVVGSNPTQFILLLSGLGITFRRKLKSVNSRAKCYGKYTTVDLQHVKI